MIVIPVAVRFATHDSCPQIGLFGLSHEKCSDDFSSKSLIALIATIDSAQVGLARREDTRRGLRVGLRKWRNGLAVAPVIW